MTYFGNGTPELKVGTIGDTYVDQTNKLIYFKTDYSTWTNMTLDTGEIWSALASKISAPVDLTNQVAGLLPQANLASLQYPEEKWIACNGGSDSTGDGSFQRPWKTLEYAAAHISGNTLIHLTGFFPYDQSVGTINLPPNVALIADFPGFQISQNIVITPPAGNAQVTFVNITHFGSLSWIENTGGMNQLWYIDSECDGGITFKQNGAGVSGCFLWLRDSVAVGINAKCGQVSINDGGLFGALIFEDSGTTYLIINSTDIAAPISVSGGNFSYLSGNLADAGYTFTAAMTGNGTPAIISDSASLPDSITGPHALTLTALSQYVGYTPADISKWVNPQPTTLKEAIDRIAAVVGAGTPIP